MVDLAQTVQIEPLPMYGAALVYMLKTAVDSILRVRDRRNGTPTPAAPPTSLPCAVHEERIDSANRRLDEYRADTNRQIEELKRLEQRNFEMLMERLNQIGVQ